MENKSKENSNEPKENRNDHVILYACKQYAPNLKCVLDWAKI